MSEIEPIVSNTRERLPISLITTAYNLSLSNEPGYETKLFEQLRDVVSEICVVVQDSLDDTLDLVAPYADKLESARCIYHPEPYRELLLSMATQPWVLFLDPDMYFEDDPYTVLSACIAEGERYDKIAFVRNNYLAPDRSTPGNPWGDPALCSREGSYYLMRREEVIVAPVLLHFPFCVKSDKGLKEGETNPRAGQFMAKIAHRSLHFSTERWKIYYPLIAGRVRAGLADKPELLSLMPGVENCHWGADSTTFARGLFEPGEDGNPKPKQAVNIKDGVRVAFLGGVARNQTWPFVNYDSAEDAHVIIAGDSRLSYDSRFIERCLELFAMLPECEAVQPQFMGRIPDGMTPADVDRATKLVLAGFAGKPTAELATAYVNKHLVRGTML